MNKKLASIASALSALALSASPAFAAWPPPNPITKCIDEVDEKIIPCLIGNVVAFLTLTVAALALVFLLVGGIMYVTSAGDKMKVDQAKNVLTAAVTGFVIALTAYIIMKVVCNIIGVDCGLD